MPTKKIAPTPWPIGDITEIESGPVHYADDPALKGVALKPPPKPKFPGYEPGSK